MNLCLESADVRARTLRAGALHVVCSAAAREAFRECNPLTDQIFKLLCALLVQSHVVFEHVSDEALFPLLEVSPYNVAAQTEAGERGAVEAAVRACLELEGRDAERLQRREVETCILNALRALCHGHAANTDRARKSNAPAAIARILDRSLADTDNTVRAPPCFALSNLRVESRRGKHKPSLQVSCTRSLPAAPPAARPPPRLAAWSRWLRCWRARTPTRLQN